MCFRHFFSTPMLLKLALLHSSASSAANNSLAWIGDAALHLVVSEQLCARYPGASIGDLSKVRSYLISRNKFAEYGADFLTVRGDFLMRFQPALHVPACCAFYVPLRGLVRASMRFTGG